MIWGVKFPPLFSGKNPPGFVDVKADDEEALMDAVAQQPVSVAIEADKRAFQNYQSGVLSKSLVLNGAQKKNVELEESLILWSIHGLTKNLTGTAFWFILFEI